MNGPACTDDVPLRDLDGKTAFITGGSSGIGLGVARACSAAGMNVVITYRTPKHVEEATTFFSHRPFLAIEADVTSRAAMACAADRAESAFGNIHLLCNNAGVGITTRIRDATYEDWDYAMSVNVGGVVNGVHVFLPRMLAHGEPGHIVTTSSMSGLFHGGDAGIYTTTKFAVVGLMEALRAELTSTRIGVSVLCPGLVTSRIFLANRNRPLELCNPSTPASSDPEWTAHTMEFMKHGMDPLDCGEKVLAGVRQNRMYIVTHPEFRQGIQDRCETLLGSIPVEHESAPADRVAAERRVLRHSLYAVEKDKLRLQPNGDSDRLNQLGDSHFFAAPSARST